MIIHYLKIWVNQIKIEQKQKSARAPMKIAPTGTQKRPGADEKEKHTKSILLLPLCLPGIPHQMSAAPRGTFRSHSIAPARALLLPFHRHHLRLQSVNSVLQLLSSATFEFAAYLHWPPFLK